MLKVVKFDNCSKQLKGKSWLLGVEDTGYVTT